MRKRERMRSVASWRWLLCCIAGEQCAWFYPLGRFADVQSIAFFHNINADHVVSCIDTCGKPKYAPITAWDHLMSKHLSSVGQGTPTSKL